VGNVKRTVIKNTIPDNHKTKKSLTVPVSNFLKTIYAAIIHPHLAHRDDCSHHSYQYPGRDSLHIPLLRL